MNSITILGNIVELTPIAKGSLKGLTVGDTISYYFYKGSYHGINLLFIEPKAYNPDINSHPLTHNNIRYYNNIINRFNKYKLKNK